MSETLTELRRKRESAADLQAVVRTMKGLAAASIGQYERSVRALADYYRTVELGLSACLRELEPTANAPPGTKSGHEAIDAVVFGSDQGLVGQFNEVIADFAIARLAALNRHCRVWAVGERIRTRLEEAGLDLSQVFPIPTSVNAVAPLVAQIQIATEAHRTLDDQTPIFLFYNHRQARGPYEPTSQRLLPLDLQWQRDLRKIRWPTPNLPEALGSNAATLRMLVREYLFISLFRACAESLASENASRLAAMERAEKNIDDLLESLKGSFNQLRQRGIDEELFEVVAGYESLATARASEKGEH